MDVGPQSEGFVKTTYCKKKATELMCTQAVRMLWLRLGFKGLAVF